MLKFAFLLACFAAPGAALADPLLTSWITKHSTKYARIYTSDANKTSGTSATTWSNGRLTQSLPAYGGVQDIYASADWVYVRSTGLGNHVMGPWYDDAARTRAFVNLPLNQKDLFRIPRKPVVTATKSAVRGELGFFVDGVHAFDASDATSYSTAKKQDGDPPGMPGGVVGDGIWNRDAYVNEAITFDPALAHQQNTGVYHYHANPIAPRYLLGDHVDFNASTKVYSERAGAPTQHSPIVGWAKDGFPIYGPYGYATANNPASGLRRMVSGYVQRNGQNGTTNLAATGRQSLPAWATRVSGRSSTLSSAQYGPAVGTAFPLGRYLEDNDYLGDLGKVQGTDFDLDEYNGRQCVTPEYPSGTYAYFVAITAAGTPAYPYNVGRSYYGTPSGGIVSSIAETVTTHFQGGPDQVARVQSATPVGNDVTIVWSSTEGGTYKLEGTSDLKAGFTTVAAAKIADANAVETKYLESGGAATQTQRFYRVSRTALAAYDPVTGTRTAALRRAPYGPGGPGGLGGFGGPGGPGGPEERGPRPDGRGGIASVTPASARRGSTVTVTVNLETEASPPLPPAHVPVLRVNLGTLASTRSTHTGLTKAVALFTIPFNAAAGAQDVSVAFPGPPDRPRDVITYTLERGFTVQ